jgi:serine/threonine-protein kinase
LEPGTLDGRVELRELVGEGGMGEVHAAWDRSLERAVAVKFVRGSGPLDAERLLLEARLQARVEHPHVVRVFEVGSLQGRPCILFQLVRGRSLAELAAGLSLADRVELVRQASTGLHAAHLQGLVHRDVKPGNILVEEAEDGTRTALVTDFGLAHAEEGGLTRSGLLPGTLDFMAPEQLAGTGPADSRSDVYALGATLYAVLAGRPPFRIPSARPEAGAEEQVKLLRRILDEDAPPLRSVAPGVPRELSLLAAKAMEKEPAARYPSAAAFAEDLARFQRGEPVRARPTTALEGILKWSRRNPTASRAIGAALGILVAAGGFTAWLSHQAGQEALEAARLGAVASSLESRMRMEYLSPPHDLRPALAAVKKEVEALRPLAAMRNGGPASFALGKGLDLLGDLDGARAAYQRAWDLGFQSPQAAEGLGLAMARVFERERSLARQTLAAEARDRAVAALRAELLEPAQRVLRAVDRIGAHGAWLDATLAAAEGETGRARARAQEALAADPSLYEAQLLEGRAFVQEGKDLIEESRIPDAQAALEKALAVLALAQQAGRSDVAVLRVISDAQFRRGLAADRSGDEAGPHFAQALATTDLVESLDRDDPWLFHQRGAVRSGWGMHAARGSRGDALALLRASVADLRRARELAPAEVLVADRYLYSLYALSYLEHQRGEPAREELEEGVVAFRSAVAMAPASPAIRHDGFMLLLVRARELRRGGKRSLEAFGEAIQEGEAALRLLPRKPAVVLEGLVEATLNLGEALWDAGEDPRPTLRRGLERADELGRLAPGVASLTKGLWAVGTAANVFQAMGEDVEALSARAMALAEEARQKRPGLVYLELLHGEAGLIEVERRLAVGQDPTPALDPAAERIEHAARTMGERIGVQIDVAVLPLLRGRRHMLLGSDPAADLTLSEQRFQALLRARPRHQESLAGLARVALVRGQWARRQGRSAEAAARAGLAHAAGALAVEGGDPLLWVLQARLQALAGDPPACRASLDKAYAMQPLVRGGPDAKAAEAELAR